LIGRDLTFCPKENRPRAFRPGAFASSGSNAIVHYGRLDPSVHLIGKSFTYTELAAKVRRTLEDH